MIDWLAYNFVRAVGWLLCRLSPDFAVGLGQSLGRLAMRLQPKRRRMAGANLRAAFDGKLEPKEVDRLVTQCFEQLGAGIPELLRLPVIDPAYADRYVTIQGRSYFDGAVASGRPVILLTGHYGNWELSSIVAALKGYPVVALARAQNKFPRLYRLLLSYRESKGCRVVHKGSELRLLIDALKNNKLVGIVGDQASRQGVFVDFFGRPALFAIGPFDLAHTYHALIVPFFIHRVQGPHHRLCVEEPIDLSATVSRDDAIRQGAERFAAGLMKHIRQDPGQWLWMHNRWKHTPARRAVILSDGKAGHVKQSQAVVKQLRAFHPSLTTRTVEIRFRSKSSRALCLAWAAFVPGALGARWILKRTLDPLGSRQLLSRQADIVVSCGSVTASVNRLWSRFIRAKSVVLMNPAPIPVRHFDLVLAPRHDKLPRAKNVVRTPGAFAVLDETDLRRAAQKLPLHPRYRPWSPTSTEPGAEDAAHPVITLLVGGDTDAYTMGAGFAGQLADTVLAACASHDAWCAVTTSRRTPQAAESALSDRLERSPVCRILVRASSDPLPGTMDGLLGMASVVVVTGESISMVSEACASGRPVIAVEPPLRAARGNRTKHRRFLEDMAADGHIRRVQPEQLRQAIADALKQAAPTERRDSLESVREALKKLI